MRSEFKPPRVTNQGSLLRVSATVSKPGISDRNLKEDITGYDPVLPRIKKLTPSTPERRR